ncbi:hypothetical protein IWW36_001638 [Coemansia brasiliensis]|uniref:AB hydrolase-1 domain-containing protein n=1 Tax=Coemansia brasiliensis TaxID=2650707 RepID=A0A9W8I9A9_9FUNG|nr:hypothetical protein IWW36_001638 [Coemansia brasiliensis]
MSSKSEAMDPVWGSGRSSSGLSSLFGLWPRASSKNDHELELALLAESGLKVVSPGRSSDMAQLEPQQKQPQQNEPTTLATKPDADVVAELLDVDIDSAGNYIHTLAIRNGRQQTSPEGNPGTAQHNLVLTHGYFTGLGFFFRNYHELSQVPNWNIYSIDWLGMGRSSRPKYLSRRGESEDARVAHAESFFVESLEEWRKRVGIERMTLCGHSFGGYMSALYALKHPDRVEKLVLISPIGIPEAPPDFDEKLRQGYGPARRRSTPTDKQTTPDYERAEDSKEASAAPSRTRIMWFRLAMGLWERNFAPQWIVRSAGPFGRRLIDWYVNRFEWLSETQRTALAAYAHQISVLPGSSESALGDILKPGAFARRPLVQRLDAIAVPTVFMYGANDWVDFTGGQQVIRRIAGRVATRLFRIPEAGHNLHLENPTDFNRILVSEMQALE